MPKKREINEAGELQCARCGLFVPPSGYSHPRDSYCTPCRKEYSREYNENRKATDPKFLPIRAARARKRYRTDEKNRALRLEAGAKWRSKVENEMAKAEKGIKPTPKPEPTVPAKETPRERRQELEQKWDDL